LRRSKETVSHYGTWFTEPETRNEVLSIQQLTGTTKSWVLVASRDTETGAICRSKQRANHGRNVIYAYMCGLITAANVERETTLSACIIGT